MNGVRKLFGRGWVTASLLCGACSTKYEPIVNSNEVMPGDLASVDRELSPQESQKVVDAMAATRTPQDIAATKPLEQSPRGRWSEQIPKGRWSDGNYAVVLGTSEVPLAAVLGAKDVEMAVVNWFQEPDGLRFTIIALNNDPGELKVFGDPMHGVTGATAKLGLFDERTKDADTLVASFYSRLHALGSIPRPAPKPQSADAINQ